MREKEIERMEEKGERERERENERDLVSERKGGWGGGRERE